MNKDQMDKFSITDAQNEIKKLNDYLLYLGELIDGNQASIAEVERVVENAEFSRLVANMAGFTERANKVLADFYKLKATMYQSKIKGAK